MGQSESALTDPGVQRLGEGAPYEAKQVADLYFFETVVRIHRASESLIE